MNTNFVKKFSRRLLAKCWQIYNKNSSPRGHFAPILMYHSVNPNHHYSISPAAFDEQLRYLSSNYTIISLSSLVEMLRKDNILYSNPVVLTFDDGYEDNYYYAYSLLKKYGCSATIFLCPGFIDEVADIHRIGYPAYKFLKPLNWQQIEEMHNNGISFGSHTYSHSKLTAISYEEAEAEIRMSKDKIETVLGQPIHFFTYPWGFYNQKIIRILKNTGFYASCSTIWSTRNCKENLFALNRIRVDCDDTLYDFKQKVCGAYDFMRFVQLFYECLG